MTKAIFALLLSLIISSAYGQEMMYDVPHAEITSLGKQVIKNVNTIKTYQFMLVKREYVENKDTGYQYINVKAQIDPLQVYVKFIKPARYAGREALYKDGGLVVKRGGRSLSGMVLHIRPDSPLAMEGNKYPITHINPKEICTELIDKINKELKFPLTRVYKKAGASIYKHPGIHYKLIHTTERPGMQCMTAEMLISTELGIPIYFKVVGWNRKTLEEYAFKDMVINPKFKPKDFDEENKEYGFTREAR